MSEIKATWIVQLNCECPGCKKQVNLLDYADFFEWCEVVIAEHDTDNSQNMLVVCPECYHEFQVDLDY